ncbi:protein-L-isoaspartate O-methyltransferase family protein [Ancylobacter defluvii]|uniref:Protein-L-isoaspartate O-methyltransferase n=1 Tax=Ancylobacter defluvii TaxID=1282440 RepID=A0A9W6JW02_9HYPH|nr:protein-L-isoaspartate O-methyltransferase [Ancylobacter defluvii]MBS7587888.1 protein-L-isoaspartate O-methyltransferase [Ancylobacter defluvii]GLK83568.1 protein-L-isoaspartate O-methyltransferase [Ancylobacter defluvii]
MIDFAEMRRAMVDAQVRANDVTDLKIVAAMMETPRERFVPAGLRNFAYIDDDLLVKEGAPARYLMEPMVLAKLLQAAEIGDGDLVLDVGASSGYSTAVLAKLAGQVVALEEDAELADRGAGVLTDLGLLNAAYVKGALTAGWPGEAPYDAILLNGSVDEAPQTLLSQLKPGGRLVAVVGRGRAGRATVFTNTAGGIGSRVVFDAAVPTLPGFEAAPSFVF